MNDRSAEHRLPRRHGISRRGLLRAGGAALALPFLESLRLPAAFAAPSPVRRLVFVFVPNGVNRTLWSPPKGVSDALELSPTLAPLAAHRDRLLVFSGLTLDGGRAHGDGPGDHARAAASYLTAAHPVKTAGEGIRAGISVDQVAAQALRGRTRFASLELGCERGAVAGACDSGYSCAYSSNVSWRSPSVPNVKETVPRRAFERLFAFRRSGEDDAAARSRLRTRRSVLDHVAEDARRLRRGVSHSDRARLDEYLTGIREIEQRLDAVSGERGTDLPAPPGTPADYAEHVRLMYETTALALRTDATRVVTFMLGNAGSPRSYRMVDVPDAHHGLSHHGDDAAKLERIGRIDRFHVERFAAFLDVLAETKDAGGAPLLDSTLVMYGSGLGDGNRHEHHDLPIVLAGAAPGVRTGRRIDAPAETPLAALYLTLLASVGAPARSFGDSDAPLDLS